MMNEMMVKVRHELEKRQLDGAFFSQIDNVRYVSGYTGDDAYLVLTKDKQYFLTDPRYTEQAAQECPDWEIVNWRQSRKAAADVAAELCRLQGCHAVGYEATALNVDNFQKLQDGTGAELCSISGLVEVFRAVKTSEEIACSRIACDIACRAFERILKDIRVGVTEKELASLLSHYMVLEGADTKPYGNILISGARTSLLHGIPSAKAVEYGDFVLMDFGCAYHGYLSDMTRTVVVGKATAKQREVYELERKMTEAGTTLMKPGQKLSEVYQATRAIIEDTEYLPYHYPNIGHGIGVFVHEIPFISPAAETVFQPGNIVTIEPGIYIPGWGGVRIEDQILITEHRNENLVTATHELLEL